MMYDSGAEPLEDDDIRMIPKVKISPEHLRNSQECSVCLEYFKSNEEAKVLPCNHLFHERCIDPWLLLRGTCPDCRRNVLLDAGDDEIEEGQIDEETLSGYESAHSSHRTRWVQSYASIVSYDSITDNNRDAFPFAEPDGALYNEDIDDDAVEEVSTVLGSTLVVLRGLLEQSSSRLGESHHRADDLRDDLTASFSEDITFTTRSPVTSPLWVSDDERDVTNNDTTIDFQSIGDSSAPSSPSIFTVSEAASDDDVEMVSENWGTRRWSPFQQRVPSQISLDSSSDRMSTDSESIEEVSSVSNSDYTIIDFE